MMLQAKNKRLISGRMFVLLWSLLLPIPAVIFSGIFIWYFQVIFVPAPVLSLSPINSGQYQDILIDTLQPSPLSELSITISGVDNFGRGGAGSGPYVSIMVQLLTMTYHSYYWGDGAPSPPPGTGPHVGHPFNQASVLALLDYVGADTSQPDVQAAARELITIVRAINTNQGLTGSSTTQFYSSYNKQNYDVSTKHLTLAAWIFWIVIWVLGLLLYHLIDRKTHSPQITATRPPATTTPPTGTHR